MTIREGPSQELRPPIKYHRHHRGLPTPALLNFSSVTMAKRKKMTNTGDITAYSGFVLVKCDPSVTVLLPQRGQLQSNPSDM